VGDDVPVNVSCASVPEKTQGLVERQKPQLTVERDNRTYFTVYTFNGSTFAHVRRPRRRTMALLANRKGLVVIQVDQLASAVGSSEHCGFHKRCRRKAPARIGPGSRAEYAAGHDGDDGAAGMSGGDVRRGSVSPRNFNRMEVAGATEGRTVNEDRSGINRNVASTFQD
jgi:hypothetical protein